MPVIWTNAMKIDKSTPSLPSARTAGLGKNGSAHKAPAGGTASGDTSVSIGDAALQLNIIASGVADAPAVNAAKVAEIKQAISNGVFQVNSSAVADSLIKSVQDLIGPTKA
jgi:negative regulator of flagellin synthesis FlgM